MTLTSAEVAKMQKHNADLVRENETLTRDNAELRNKSAVVDGLHEHKILCDFCEYFINCADPDYAIDGFECYRGNSFKLRQPPDA